jgi:perosamine synthetase
VKPEALITPAVLGGPPVFPDGPPHWPTATEAIQNAIRTAVEERTWGHYHGPRSCDLEAVIAGWFGIPHAIACASGTLAVEVALRAVGVLPGDEVLLAAYEYESNFLTVHALGAKPVLLDVSPQNWNLSVSELERAVSSKTKAIICSHLHGGIVPMPGVVAFAESHKIAVIEDAAQCPGARIGSRYCGTFGEVGTISFGGSKLLSAGRGGAILLRDSRAYQRAKVWLTRGVQEWATLSELQAVVLFPQFEQLQQYTQKRWEAVQQLEHAIENRKILGLRRFQNHDATMQPAFYKVGFQYSPLEFGLSRELFVKAMRAEGVAFDAGFRALHVGRSPSRFRAVGALTESQNASDGCVKLHHPVLLEPPERREQVAQALEKVYRNSERIRAAN